MGKRARCGCEGDHAPDERNTRLVCYGQCTQSDCECSSTVPSSVAAERLRRSAPRLLAALKRAEPQLAALSGLVCLEDDVLDAVRAAIAEAEEA